MKRIQKKQAGFTILEIGIVMVILISLVITFSSALWEKQTASDIQLIQTFFERSVPDGMASARVHTSNVLVDMTQAEFVDYSGTATTVVGIPWTMDDVTVNSMATFTMDLQSMSERDVVGDTVIANLKTEPMGHIDTSAATNYTGTTLTVVIRAR